MYTMFSNPETRKPCEDARRFVPEAIAVEGRCSHPVAKVYDPDTDQHWFRKRMENPDLARLEVLGRELLRLIVPNQPAVHLVKNTKVGTCYVMSEAVEGFRPLPQNEQDKFNHGTYANLGSILLVSIVLENVDVKNSNIGVNCENDIMLVDGDWFFARIRAPQHYNIKNEITLLLLDNLTKPTEQFAFNWLDYVQNGVCFENSQIIDKNLSLTDEFKYEVNSAILRFLLLPPIFIDLFIKAIVPDPVKAAEFYNFIILRIEQLRESAALNISFGRYLTHTSTRYEASQFLSEMLRFTVNNGKNAIIFSQHRAEFDKEFRELKSRYIQDVVYGNLKPAASSSFFNISEQTTPSNSEPHSPFASGNFYTSEP